MKIKQMILVLCIGIALGGGGMYFLGKPTATNGSLSNESNGRNNQATPRVISVITETVQTQEVNDQVSAVGTLLSNESVTLKPETSGKITTIVFNEGQEVKKGQVLIRLDAATTEAELAQAQANLQLAQSKYDRALSLEKNGFISPQAREEADNLLRVQKANLSAVRARLQKYTLLAPFNGLIGLRQVSQGDYVKEGDALVTIEDMTRLKVEFRVPELYFQGIHLGQPLELLIDAFPDDRFDGQVYALEPKIDDTGKSIIIRAFVNNTDKKLRPGMFARVRLELGQTQQRLLLPETAIISQGGVSAVFLVDDNKAKRVIVSLGHRYQDRVEVLSGLNPGDVVVTEGSQKLKEGASVSITPAGI